MSESSNETPEVGLVPDEDLPEDLQPEENPLARDPDEDGDDAGDGSPAGGSGGAGAGRGGPRAAGPPPGARAGPVRARWRGCPTWASPERPARSRPRDPSAPG